MTSADLRRWIWVPLLAAACGGGSSSRALAPAGPNVVPISVDGAGCLANAYFNEPCASVQLCVPGTSTCQTISGLLLDTGSSGLRVFSQALTLQLPAVTAGGNPVGECVGYLDGSSQWGPVVQADVVLGGEPAVKVPIQVVQSTFATAPSNCSGSQTDPATAGYNGILGVSQWIQDCGPGCAQSTNNNWYFSCNGATCTGTALPYASQVTNPVAALPTDGNGVIVELPAIPATGAASVAGSLVLGIGTRTNNVPGAGVEALSLDGSGLFQSTMPGMSGTDPAFLDTGSNGIFIPQPSPPLATCNPPDNAWYCPASPVTLTATHIGATGSPSRAVSFQITSIDALGGSVGISPAVGGPDMSSSPQFDWGLPFHFGRNVYVGIEGTRSPLGAGPLAAY